MSMCMYIIHTNLRPHTLPRPAREADSLRTCQVYEKLSLLDQLFLLLVAEN